MKNWIVNNFWIKILSLILAVITWFYVNGELDKERRIPRKFYKPKAAGYRQKKKPPVQKKEMNRGYIVEKK
ncbi:hypothetical protein ACFL28_03255 [Candidatus Omnitrophota bacterium]